MLTKKQLDLLTFIDEYLKDNGYTPSYEEMKDAVGLKSKSGVHQLIQALEERHFVRRNPGHARTLEVLRLPQEVARLTPVSNDNMRAVPLCGKIAAGCLIEAINDRTEMVYAPAQMMGSGDHYALLVEGDSMKNAGIMDGDTVIIRSCKNADDGEIVVALVDGYEVTLKRLRKKARSIALEPENEAYETRIFDPSRVEVQGKLVGLMRSY